MKIILVLLLCIFSSPLFARIDNPPLLLLGAGMYNVLRDDKTTTLQLEYRGAPFWGQGYVQIRSLLVGISTNKGTLYSGGGVAFDVFFGSKVVLTPAFATGFYRSGKDKKLGYPWENRSSIEGAYRFDSLSRLGLQFYHISNASLGKRNPGVESLVLFYAFCI